MSRTCNGNITFTCDTEKALHLTHHGTILDSQRAPCTSIISSDAKQQHRVWVTGLHLVHLDGKPNHTRTFSFSAIVQESIHRNMLKDCQPQWDGSDPPHGLIPGVRIVKANRITGEANFIKIAMSSIVVKRKYAHYTQLQCEAIAVLETLLITPFLFFLFRMRGERAMYLHLAVEGHDVHAYGCGILNVAMHLAWVSEYNSFRGDSKGENLANLSLACAVETCAQSCQSGKKSWVGAALHGVEGHHSRNRLNPALVELDQ